MLLSEGRWQRKLDDVDGVSLERKDGFLESRSDPEPEERELAESKLFTEDGGVGGGLFAVDIWLFVEKRGRAVVARGRVSSTRRRKIESFTVRTMLMCSREMGIAWHWHLDFV